MPKRRRSCLKTRHGLLISLTVLLVVLALYFSAPDVFELIELRLLDWRTLLRGPVDPGPTVKLILLDGRSRERYGMNEDMRRALAVMLTDMCAKGVRVIGLDLFFISTQEEADPSKVELAEAMKKCGNIVMGYNWEEVFEGSRLGAAEAVGRRRLLDAARNPDEIGFTPESIPYGASAPDPRLMRNAAALGFFTVLADPFNLARKIPAALLHESILHYPFSLAVTRVFLRGSDYHFPVRARIPFLKLYLEGVNLATDPFGYLLLNQYGKADAFESLSFADAAKRGVPEEFAKDSVVLIGVSGEASNDQFSTMFDPDIPGLALHATAVANALSHGFLWRDMFVRGIEVALLTLLALVIGLFVPRMHPTFAICLGPALMIVVWLLSNQLLGAAGMWIQLVCPMLLVALSHVGVITARMYAAERVCRQMRGFGDILEMKKSPDSR